MKKLVFLFFLIFSFLFSEEYTNGKLIVDVGAFIGRAPDGWRCSIPSHAVFDRRHQKCYYLKKKYHSKIPYNSSCLKRNKFSSYDFYIPSSYVGDYFYKVSEASFCKEKKGYVYNKYDDVWYPANGDPNLQPICPNGEVFDYKQEKCIKKKTCDDYKKDCASKCGGLNNVKNFTCSGDSYKCECATCKDLIKLAINNCSSKNMKVGNFTCSDKDGYIVSSTSDYLHLTGGDASFCIASDKNSSSNIGFNDKNLTCSADEDIVIDSNGDVYCEKSKDDNNTQDNGSVNDSNNSDFDNNSDNSNNSSNNSNDRDNDENEDNKKSCSVDLCERYKNPQLGDSWTQQDNCWVWLNAPSNCPNKVCIGDGNCLVPNSGSSGSSNSNNIDLSGIIDQQKITNNKLTSINKTLEDIKDLKPDNNFNPDGYNKDTTDYSSFSQYIDNAKDLISNLVDSVNNLKNLLENPKKITLFDGDSSYVCPLSVNLYSKSITLDICKFVSPYRPILSLFFTLFFSFQVFFMFFKHVLKGGE